MINWSEIPDLAAVALLTIAFSSVSRRNQTPQSKIWLTAWGMIALHFGDTADAKLRLSRALALNPQFHPVYADEARLVLASLDSRPDSHPAQP